MARTAGGDADAFGQLVDRHQSVIYAFLTRLTGSRERADDLAQETFLRLHGAAPRYSENGHFRAYLFRIATNLARDADRRERRWKALAAILPAAVPVRLAPSPQEELLGSELEGEVAAAVAELPIRHRVPLVLHEIEGWPLDQIADFVGCRVGTVKSRLARARARLRIRLAPYLKGEAA